MTIIFHGSFFMLLSVALSSRAELHAALEADISVLFFLGAERSPAAGG